MNKILKYIIIFFLIILIGMIVVYFYIIKTDDRVENFEDLKEVYIFGRSTEIGDGTDGNGFTSDNEETPFVEIDNNQELPILRKISSAPIAGFFVGEGFVIYTDKATGHIYEANTGTISQKRLSNTTIPKIYESIWLNNNSFIFRYLDVNDNIKSFYAEISENNEIEGVFLQDNIKQVVSAGNQIFYLLADSSGSRGITSDLDGDNKELIFNSFLTEWLVQRPQKGILTFTTKPSANVFGYLYFFNTNNGSMDKILDNIKGLTTLTNKNKTKILFSESARNTFTLNVYDVVENTVNKLTIQTLPEKCVWSNDNENIYCGVPKIIEKGNYPDVWYQGINSFSDEIFKIDTENNSIELVNSLENTTDLIELSLDPEEKYLYFINKKDLSLWGIQLE